MGHNAFNVGAGAFSIGTWNLGACLSIDITGKVRCNQGLYNSSGVRIASVYEVLAINPQTPTNPDNQTYAFTVDASGNSYAIMGSSTKCKSE